MSLIDRLSAGHIRLKRSHVDGERSDKSLFFILSANLFFTVFIICMDILTNNISFQARVGKNALKVVKNEFDSDMSRVKKFEQLFEDTFAKNLDKGTIVDLDKNNNFVFSHSAFPKIEYKSNENLTFKKSFANSLLFECPKTLANIENKMFRTIISKGIKSGKTFEEIENNALKIFLNEKAKNRFSENIYLAKRIKQQFPKSELRDFEFDYMNNLVMEEEAETPGTELYNIVHNFGGLSFK